jgi:hypothetical protein
MRQGYSILLGETLEASELEYHDCESFQVVCPTCREPLFKGVRVAGREDALHYLSHYSTSASVTTECELRAARSAAQVATENRVSREQRLEYFLSVLRRTLSLDPMYTKSAESTHWQLNKATGFTHLRNECFELAVQNRDNDAYFLENARDYVGKLENVGWKLQTSFSRTVQMRIAHDMWRTLTTPLARSNYDFLFNHAFVKELGRWNRAVTARVPGHEFAAQMVNYCGRLIASRGVQGRALLREMAMRAIPSEAHVMRDGTLDTEPSSYLLRLASSTTIEMAGVLVGVPYFELLKQQYGDSGKVYPYVASEVPESEEEKRRMIMTAVARPQSRDEPGMH